MQDYRININYAKALFLLAMDSQMLDAVANDARLVNDVCSENHELNTVFSNPVIKEAKKIAIITDLFQNHVSKLTMLFLQFVVRKKRSVNLKGITSAYLDLYRDSKNVILSKFTSVNEIGEDTVVLVKKIVTEYTGKEVELDVCQDSRLKGGFTLEFDNNMYDASLRTKFLRLRRAFEENVYQSKM